MKDMNFLGKLFGADVLGAIFLERRDGWIKGFNFFEKKSLKEALEKIVPVYLKIPVTKIGFDVFTQSLSLPDDSEVIRAEVERIEIKIFYKEI